MFPERGSSFPKRGRSSRAQERGRRLFREVSWYVPLLDGVVLVDPDYLKDRKGTGPKSRGLRASGG